MMPIHVICPHCGRAYNLSDDLLGKKFRCKGCLEIVEAVPVVRGSSASATDQTLRDKPIPGLRSSGPRTVQDSAGAGQARSKAPADRKPSAAVRQNEQTPAARTAPGAHTAPGARTVPGTRTDRSAGGQRAGSASGAKANASDAGQDRPKRGTSGRSAGRRKNADDFDYEVEDYRFVDENDVYEDYAPDAEAGYAEVADPWSSTGTSSSSSSGSRRSRQRAGTTRKARAGSGSWRFGFNIGRLNVAMVVIGFVLLMIGSMELSLARKSGGSPVSMTLSELLQNGPGASIYLTVSGIRPVSDEFVYEQTTRGGSSRYTKVYIPCRAADSGDNAPVKFILFSAKAADDSAVDRLMSQSTHTGMIINTIRKLGNEELNLLQSGIPNANLREAYIFESGRKPSGMLLCVLMLGGGLALLAGGAFLIFVRRD